MKVPVCRDNEDVIGVSLSVVTVSRPQRVGLVAYHCHPDHRGGLFPPPQIASGLAPLATTNKEEGFLLSPKDESGYAKAGV